MVTTEENCLNLLLAYYFKNVGLLLPKINVSLILFFSGTKYPIVIRNTKVKILKQHYLHLLYLLSFPLLT